MKMNLPGVHGGVSQQTPSLRLQNQHESASNVVFDVIDGVKTRWPLRRVDQYALTGLTFVGSVKTTDGILWMCYHRYAAPNWTLYMVPDDPDVTPVTLTGASGYLAVDSTKVKTYAILDTLLMVNQDKEVALKEIVESPTFRGTASYGLVYCPKVYEGNTVKIQLDFIPRVTTSNFTKDQVWFTSGLTYTAAASETAEDYYASLRTQVLANSVAGLGNGSLRVDTVSEHLTVFWGSARVNYGGRLWQAKVVNTNVTPVAGATWEDIGAAVPTDYPTWSSAVTYYTGVALREAGMCVVFTSVSADFEVRLYSTALAEAPYNVASGNYFVTVANSFERLPPRINPLTSEIIIFRLSEGYYVQFLSTSQTYEETAMVGHRYYIDKTTVPHELRYTVATKAWALSSVDAYETNGRLVGDSTSAPLPLFVGKKLNGVFFYRNRLCFLSLNNVSMSRVGNYYQFFPDTATEVLDSDPISVFPAYKDYSPLLYGIPFNKQLLLIGPEKQYVLHSGYDALSPTTVAIDEATSYKLLPQMEPLLLENSLVLFLDQGEYAGVLEYRLSDQEIATEGAILTDNVPRYIPNDITNALYLQSEHMILCYKQDSDTVYVYKFHKNEGGQRMQSAWCTWVWPSSIWSSISGVATRDESTVIFCSQGYMYSMSTDEDVLAVPALDILGEQEFTDGMWSGLGLYYPLGTLFIEKTTGKQVELDEDDKIIWDGTGTTKINVWGGIPIEWSLELSPLILRDDNGLPRADLKSTIKNLQVDWSGGDFRVKTFGTNLPTRTTDVTPVTYQIHEIVPGESMRQVHPSRVLVMADSKRCRISLERGLGFNHVKIHNIAYNLEIRKDKG